MRPLTFTCAAQTHRCPHAHPHLKWPFCASAGCTPRCALTTRRNCVQARATCCDPRCCVRTARRAVAAAHWPSNAQLTVGRTGRKIVVVTTRLWRDFKSTAGACSFPSSFFVPTFPQRSNAPSPPPSRPRTPTAHSHTAARRELSTATKGVSHENIRNITPPQGVSHEHIRKLRPFTTYDLRPAAWGIHPAGGGPHVFRPCDRNQTYWGRGRRGRRPTPPKL